MLVMFDDIPTIEGYPEVCHDLLELSVPKWDGQKRITVIDDDCECVYESSDIEEALAVISSEW